MRICHPVEGEGFQNLAYLMVCNMQKVQKQSLAKGEAAEI
jgi:hypothetical protein